MKRLLMLLLLLPALLLFIGCEEEGEDAAENGETVEGDEVEENGETANEDTPKYDFTVTEMDEMNALVIKQQGPYEQYPVILEEAIPALVEAGIEMTGAPFGIYYDDPGVTAPEDLRWVLGFPVAEGTEAPEGFEAEKYDGGQVVMTTLYGMPNWEELTVYEDIYIFIAEQGMIPAGPMVEVYRWNEDKPEENETDIFTFVTTGYPVSVEEEATSEG